MKRRAIANKATPYLLLLPTLALICIFMLYPMFRTVWLSFQHYSLVNVKNASFAGLENFQDLLKDKVFLRAAKQTIPWTIVNVALQFVLGMLVALLLNQTFKGRNIARALSFTPWAVGGTIVALIFKFMFNGSVGVISDILLQLGITETRMTWYSNATMSISTVIIGNTWRGVPFFAINILAALQSIPKELYESADVDGAGSIMKYFKITLPMIKDTLLLTTLLRTIWTLNVVDMIYSMTGGGPNYSTITLPVYIMQKFTDTLDAGYCSAMAVIMVACLALFASLYLKISRYGKEGIY